MVQAAFEGMDALAHESGIATPEQARAFLAEHGVHEEPGVPLLVATQKLAICLRANPATVQPSVAPTDRALYLQVLFRRHNALAASLNDLAEPARVDEFVIRTFGTPARAPPIRQSDVDVSMLRAEIRACESAGLVRPGAGPWASAAFLVPKPHSTTKKRVVIDYRPLNAQTVRDAHPQPHVEDVVRVVG